MALAITCELLVCRPAAGEENQVNQVSIAFGDSSRPGTVKASQTLGGITVKGYQGKEVLVETQGPAFPFPSTPRPRKPAVESLAFEWTRKGVLVDEEDNVITVKRAQEVGMMDLHIRVPFATSLKLNGTQNGLIQVEKVEGEIEVSNVNGWISLTNISGPVLAHSVNGRIIGQLDKVAPDKPLSFSTVNGDIDLVLPSQLKAKVKLETLNGAIHSEFEIAQDKSTPSPAKKDGRKTAASMPAPRGQSMDGLINGGGPLLQLKTINGSIRLRKSP